MGLIDELPAGRVGLDTAIFIHFLEASPAWLSTIDPLFDAAEAGRRELITSVITLLEVLVVPLRAGNTALAQRYETLLTRSRGVRLIDITRDQLRHAAQLRAQANIRTPDALQVSAAQQSGCVAFITNDRRLPAVPGMRIVQLSSYGSGLPSG